MTKNFFKIEFLFFILIVVQSKSIVFGSPVEAPMSLYNASDGVTILDVDNFYDGLLGHPHAWLLQFYSAYCGHCIAFAPTFKIFAKNISDWNHSIKPAVINCADGRNTALCRQYEVLGYPTLVLLPARVAKEDLGSQMGPQTHTIPSLRKNLIRYLTAQQTAGNGSSSWVNLLPFKGVKEDLFNSVAARVTHGVVVVDTANSSTAREVLMDLGHRVESAVLRWSVNGSGLARSVQSVPSVVVVERDSGAVEVMNALYHNAPSLAAVIRKHLNLPSRQEASNSGGEEEGLGAGDGLDTNDEEMLNIDRFNYDDQLPDSYYSPGSTRYVYLVDVENAIRVTLLQEVSIHKTISGDKLKALKNYLKVLVKYLPARPKVHAFLSDLSKSVARFEHSMSNSEFNAALDKAGEHGVFPELQPWVGCQGSEPHLRGFPCGLWTTFHMLTVSAISDQQSHPLETLKAIHGFVKYFFSCSHCSQHFQEMYAVDAESSVSNPSDAVLWLWSAHNKVNLRIAGELSDDPMHPKVQYPPRILCPKCWKRDSPSQPFKKQEVINYLMKTYSKDALSLQNIIHPDKRFKSNGKKGVHRGSSILVDGAQVYRPSDVDSQRSIIPGLSDLSTCMILYSSTTVIVALVCLAVVVRRRIRRKRPSAAAAQAHGADIQLL